MAVNGLQADDCLVQLIFSVPLIQLARSFSITVLPRRQRRSLEALRYVPAKWRPSGLPS